MNTEMPSPRFSLSVYAATRQKSQMVPLVMKFLRPLMTYRSPFFSARVARPAASEPVLGSVMA